MEQPDGSERAVKGSYMNLSAKRLCGCAANQDRARRYQDRDRDLSRWRNSANANTHGRSREAECAPGDAVRVLAPLARP